MIVLRHSFANPKRLPMEDHYIPEPNSGCWLWIKALDRYGYGQINIRGRSLRAHRVVFEEAKGPIPAGLVLDHKCRIRSCVNPDHLEPVTVAENLMRGEGPAAQAARKTHCIHGHAFAPENTRVYKNVKGWVRQCRECDSNRYSRLKAARRNKNLPVVRSSFSNPYIWGWHRYLWAIGMQKGTRL